MNFVLLQVLFLPKASKVSKVELCLHKDSVGLRTVIFLSTSELPEFLVDYFILNLPCSFYDSDDFISPNIAKICLKFSISSTDSFVILPQIRHNFHAFIFSDKVWTLMAGTLMAVRRIGVIMIRLIGW